MKYYIFISALVKYKLEYLKLFSYTYSAIISPSISYIIILGDIQIHCSKKFCNACLAKKNFKYIKSPTYTDFP